MMKFIHTTLIGAIIAFSIWASLRFMIGDFILQGLRRIVETPLEEAYYLAPSTGFAIALLLSNRQNQKLD